MTRRKISPPVLGDSPRDRIVPIDPDSEGGKQAAYALTMAVLEVEDQIARRKAAEAREAQQQTES